MFMKSLLSFFVGLFSPVVAIPVNTMLTLVSDPSFNKITVTIDPVAPVDASSTAVTTLTGSVQAFLNVDPANGETVELTLANGRANGTDMTFARSIPFLGGYTMNVTNLSTAIHTINPPGIVTASVGDFAANQHRFEIDQGTITGTTSGFLSGSTINQVFDSQNPASGVGSGIGSVILTPAGFSGIYQNFTVTVIMAVEINDEFISGANTIRVTGTGILKGEGILQVPRTAYLGWTVAEGIPDAPFEGDPDGDGVSHGMLWALGLSVTEDPLVHLLRPDPAFPGGFIVQLPARGTAWPILIESSQGLSNWVPVTAMAPVANPIPTGTSGIVTVPNDTSSKRFLRMRVIEP